MEFRAQARYMRVSPQKARLLLDLLKGKRGEDALNTLVFTKKRVAATVEKLLRSAIANAEQKAQAENVTVDVDDLWVKECFVGKGVTKHRRRVRPSPMGRAYRERRHYSHITIRVSSEEREQGATPKAKSVKVEKKAPKATKTKQATEKPAEQGS